MKKLMWTALATVASATAAALTVRGLDRLWRRATGEPPPEMPGWARFLVGRPIKKQIVGRVHPDTV